MMKKILLMLCVVSILIACSQEEEPSLILSEGEITSEVHRKNVGKIAFMGDWVTLDRFKQKHFIDEISISNSSEFAFRIFLNKTLTYYLSQLEPDLSVRELCKKGNFQITFIVDNKSLFQHNLPTGAGSCEYKNSTTAYGIPLSNKNNPDHWGRFLWMKFMKKNGGQKALSGDNHILRIEIRPYIDNNQIKIGEIIAQGEIKLSIMDKEVADSKIAIQPIQDTDKWRISNAYYDTRIIRQLNRKIAQNYFKNIVSLVVIKDGELLIEEYFDGANRGTLHDTRSVGKTLASTVMGIAIEEGYIKNENQTLGNYYDLTSFKNYDPKKEKVTLKSLLTMSSGFLGSDMDPNSSGNEENMYPTSDWVKFGLDLPIDNNKTIGKNWDYFTAGAVILGDILNKKVPGGLERYTDIKLLQPLGITNYKWQYTPTKVANTAGGFQMSSLDNARYGQLYLDNGVFNKRQILSTKWIQASLSKQIALPEKEEEYYGYLLWNKKYRYLDSSIEAFYASGNGGNKIVILKEIGVVIVVIATAYGEVYMHHQADEIIEDYILPSISNK